jgi:hypothetical protein
MYKVVLTLLAATVTACTQTNASDTLQPAPKVACTEEAKQCPDGSWVGRSGPRCEFICPPPLPN